MISDHIIKCRVSAILMKVGYVFLEIEALIPKQFVHNAHFDHSHVDCMVLSDNLLYPDLNGKYAVLQTWVRDHDLSEHNQQYHIMQIMNPNSLWKLKSPYPNMEKQMETKNTHWLLQENACLELNFWGDLEICTSYSIGFVALIRTSSRFLQNCGFISAHTWHVLQTFLTSSVEKGKFLEHTYCKSLVTHACQRPAWISSKLYLLDSAEQIEQGRVSAATFSCCQVRILLFLFFVLFWLSVMKANVDQWWAWNIYTIVNVPIFLHTLWFLLLLSQLVSSTVHAFQISLT